MIRNATLRAFLTSAGPELMEQGIFIASRAHQGEAMVARFLNEIYLIK